MGKRGKKKQQRRPIVIQQTAGQFLPTPLSVASPARAFVAPRAERQRAWKRIPRWLWTSVSSAIAVFGLWGTYPTLSINEDYAFDTVFPYNTSFSITNEGFWPITDLSVTCGADFVMRPWTNDPSDKSSMNLHTDSSEYKDFAKIVGYKHRLTLPCNHNVVANGHRIDPGAKLHVKVTYGVWGLKIRLHKAFEFTTAEGWNGQQFWLYK